MRRRSSHSFKFYLSLIQHQGSLESVGRGVAAGLFSSFIIPVGHMLLAFAIAVVTRGTRTVSILTTWVVNPLTMPVIYPAQCYLGSYIIGSPLSYGPIKQLVLDALHNPSTHTAGVLSGHLVASFLAGGLLFGSAAAIAGYFCTIAMIGRHRIRRAEKKEFRMNLQKAQDYK